MKNAFPNHLRLSIHESVGEHKVSMSLLNTKTGFTTPWHCSVAQLADGEWISAPMGEFQKDPRLELICEHGRPSYFKEKVLDSNVPSISEATAHYLQAPKRASGYASGYNSPSVGSALSGRSTPSAHSPRLDSGIGTPITKQISVDQDTNLSPAYGKRLIPQIMDNLAATDPTRTVFSLTVGSENGLTLRNVSALEFAKAVDRTAWWLQNKVGRSTSVQPVGYIGPRKSEFEIRICPGSTFPLILNAVR